MIIKTLKSICNKFHDTKIFISEIKIFFQRKIKILTSVVSFFKKPHVSFNNDDSHSRKTISERKVENKGNTAIDDPIAVADCAISTNSGKSKKRPLLDSSSTTSVPSTAPSPSPSPSPSSFSENSAVADPITVDKPITVDDPKAFIAKCYDVLPDNLNADDILIKLVDQSVITSEEKQAINAVKIPTFQVVTLLSVLEKKDNQKNNKFINILYEIRSDLVEDIIKLLDRDDVNGKKYWLNRQAFYSNIGDTEKAITNDHPKKELNSSKEQAKNLIVKNYNVIVDNLSSEEVVMIMKSKSMIDRVECEFINTVPDSKKMEKLLDLLIYKEITTAELLSFFEIIKKVRSDVKLDMSELNE